MASAVVFDGVEIPERLIAEEAQHHPAATPAEARQSAARALAFKALLLSRAAELGLTPSPEKDDAGREETTEEALVRQVLELEVVAPPPSEAECRRFHEARRAAPFEVERARIEDHLQWRSWAGAAARYVANLAATARAAGVGIRLTDAGEVAKAPLSLGALLSGEAVAARLPAWLAVADPDLAARLRVMAESEAVVISDVVRRAAVKCVAEADDAAWTKLVTVMREADDPALAGLAQILKAELLPPPRTFTVVRRRV